VTGSADASGAEAAEEAYHQAEAAFARMDIDALVAHLSSAVRGFTAAGDPRRAAMACVRLGDTYANALGNLTAGRAWYTRAWRLVADEEPCIEQGWVAVAAMGCDVEDPATLLAAAEVALDRARRFGDLNLETKALADAGLAHVQSGRIDEGMRLLDEAMALACGPADDVDVTSKSVCSFFTACFHAGDFQRAGDWTDLLRRRGLIGPTPGGPVFLSSHCDSVQASLLMELGRWGEAEAILLRAKADFEATMPMTAWHPDLGLADLRVLQGRFADAEALLLGKDQFVDALLPAARLHVARGDHDLARAIAQRGLRLLGDDRLRAASALLVLVDAELGRGDVEAASAACDELAERLAGLDVPALQVRAAAARARAQEAAGDRAAAVTTLEAVVERMEANRLPYLHASLLLDLAELRRAAGDEHGAVVDATAAAAVLATLDVVAPPTRSSVPTPPPTTNMATLTRHERWWTASHDGTTARLRDTKGMRYLAELVSNPGSERHALDLVDRVEGVSVDGPSRAALGDAGELVDGRARSAYRRRIEELREQIDDALSAEQVETAQSLQDELDALVRQLAAAFGLGGRARRAASVAERARLNVTRALRTATAAVAELLPGPGEELDARIRTGLYSCYEPADGEVRWIVHS
jgi:tetratricopeptide (TPR) repeat protein